MNRKIATPDDFTRVLCVYVLAQIGRQAKKWEGKEAVENI